MLRTHTCGSLRISDKNLTVKLCGWVSSRRDHGGVIFVDLRDYDGITQIVFNPSLDKKMHELAETINKEDAILVEGTVQNRPAGTENKKIKTGEIEVQAVSLKILGKSEPVPFEIDDSSISEEVRLKYRFLDLRRPLMQKNMRMRHRLNKIIRDFLDENNFVEVETPILTKSTPEGARDFLVPARLSEGSFYALPQSPQLFKQLLMVSGLDRYFQIARCFRDEDLRKDRQPEFTQLDLEMSFIDENDIFQLMEKLFKKILKDMKNIDIEIPFKRLPYKEAILKYGTDKPDLRSSLEISDLSGKLSETSYKIFKDIINNKGKVLALAIPARASSSNQEINNIIETAKTFGAKGLTYLKLIDGAVSSPVKKFFTDKEVSDVINECRAKNGDLIVFIADMPKIAFEVMGRLRDFFIDKESLKDKYNFLWVVDFPLFKYNDEEKRWESEHHPFTAPREDDIKYLDMTDAKDLDKIHSRSYDLVINGNEIASGSIRINDSSLQQKIFDTIGINKEEQEKRFGFLLNAFKYGAPPHGGIAFGLDRFLTILTGSDSIREVIAFPKTQKGVCLLTGAPSTVDAKQLKEIGIKLL